jgi:hypothetical protein
MLLMTCSEEARFAPFVAPLPCVLCDLVRFVCFVSGELPEGYAQFSNLDKLGVTGSSPVSPTS